MKVSDIISGGVFLILAALLFVHANSFMSMPGVPYGPKLFPQIISVIMGGAAIALIVSGVGKLSAEGWAQLEDWARDKSNYRLLAVIVGGFFFYIFAADSLGYLTTAFLLLVTVLSATRGVRPWLSNLAISVTATGLIYVIFSQALRVPLPVGPLERLLLGYS